MISYMISHYKYIILRLEIYAQNSYHKPLVHTVVLLPPCHLQLPRLFPVSLPPVYEMLLLPIFIIPFLMHMKKFEPKEELFSPMQRVTKCALFQMINTIC